MTTTSHRRTPPPSKAIATLVGLLVALSAAGCGAPSIATGQQATAVPADVAVSLPSVTAAGPPAATPVALRSTAPTASPTPPRPLEPFAMNLYRKGDYVGQYTLEWCVGASLQMALNMTTGKDDTTRAFQEQLWEMAQARSDSPFGGANARGWTAALNDLGIGPYELVSIPDYDEALRVAATALRLTKRPVGLVMWRGRHAWVMSGFESKGDPAARDDAVVTGVRVLDPLYPRGSSVWGKSPKPNALVSPAVLARQFVIRDRGRTNLGVPPGYLLILPTAPTAVTE